MKVSYVTHVQELTGGLKADPPRGTAKDLRDAVLAECAKKHNNYVAVTFSTPHRPRSTGPHSQSAHFNGHCQTISEETGQPMEDVRKYVKARAVSRGYPMLTDINGSPILDLWGNVQGASEADASVEECKLLIEEVHQLASEIDCVLVEDAA